MRECPTCRGPIKDKVPVADSHEYLPKNYTGTKLYCKGVHHDPRKPLCNRHVLPAHYAGRKCPVCKSDVPEQNVVYGTVQGQGEKMPVLRPGTQTAVQSPTYSTAAHGAALRAVAPEDRSLRAMVAAIYAATLESSDALHWNREGVPPSGQEAGDPERFRRAVPELLEEHDLRWDQFFDAKDLEDNDFFGHDTSGAVNKEYIKNGPPITTYLHLVLHPRGPRATVRGCRELTLFFNLRYGDSLEVRINENGTANQDWARSKNTPIWRTNGKAGALKYILLQPEAKEQVVAKVKQAVNDKCGHLQGEAKRLCLRYYEGLLPSFRTISTETVEEY